MEALVALGLFALLGGLVFSLLWGGRVLLDRQAEWRLQASGVVSALERIEGDLSSALIPGQGEPPFFAIDRREPSSSVWRGYTAVGGEEGKDSWGATHRVERVEWRVEDGSLVRKGWFTDGGEAGVRRERWEGFRFFRMEAWDSIGGEWCETWSGEKGRGLPPAVRVTVGSGLRDWNVVVVIPAGVGGGGGH